MGVDWRLLNSYKNIELNDDRADTLYYQICEVDAETESDVTNLQLLVSISQRVLRVKSLQVEEARERMEKLSKNDVERLRRENEMIKQTLNSDELDTSKRLQDYEEQLNQLQKVLNQKEAELTKSKMKSSEMGKRLMDIEKKNELLRDEVESMKEDADRHVEFDDTIEKSQQTNEKLHQKHKQVQKLLEEIKSMENFQRELSQKVTDLNHQLMEATNELNQSANEMKQLQLCYVSAHEMNQTLLKEKEFLMKEKVDLESESHASAIKCKELIDSMVKLLAEKDVEINELREQSSIRSPPSSALLPMTIGSFDSGKELELNQVKNKLQEATSQLEIQNKMVEELQNELQEAKQFVPKKTGRQQHPDSFSSPIYDAKIHELNDLIQQLEEELKSKDLQLTEIKERNKLYESGMYGLSDAMSELNNVSQKLTAKEKQVEELVMELNQLKIELNDSQDHVDFLEETAKLEGIDASYDPKSSKTEQNDKIKYVKLQHVVNSLEEQNIQLMEELRSVRSKVKHTTTSDETSTKDEESTDANQSPQTVHYLNERLNKVQDENNQLILGMREVLNALRVSDSKSDVVVECPTLERILVHFESRSVTSEKELINLITLKSELDLVRGHNEQLRIEVKELKNERKILLSYCTKHILNENIPSAECEQSNNISLDEDLLMDMSEGEVFPYSSSSSPPLHLIMPQVDQDTAAVDGIDGNLGDDVVITKEEILGRGIKLVISEVLNEPNEEEEEENCSLEKSNVTELKSSDISHETSMDESADQQIMDKEKENKEDKAVIKEVKVPCTKCPKAYAALKEVLRRMDKIISIIKQREQDKKSPIVQITASHS